MIKIHSKTLSDLEFPTICAHVSDLCTTEKGKIKALKLAPKRTVEKTHFALNQTQEYIKSQYEEQPIPNHGFDAIDYELKMLQIEDFTLELNSFRKIGGLSATANAHLVFFKNSGKSIPAFIKQLAIPNTQPTLLMRSIKW